MHGDEIDVVLHALQRLLHRIGPCSPPSTTSTPMMAMFAPNFMLNNSRSSAAMHDDHLLHIGAIQEPLGRVQPHGPPAERRERLLVRLVVKATALPGGRQDDGEVGPS